MHSSRAQRNKILSLAAKKSKKEAEQQKQMEQVCLVHHSPR